MASCGYGSHLHAHQNWMKAVNGQVLPGLVSIQLLWNPYGCCPQESGAHGGIIMFF
jgi:hypothetical protein